MEGELSPAEGRGATLKLFKLADFLTNVEKVFLFPNIGREEIPCMFDF